MSDYEYLDIFATTFNSVQQLFVNYVSILFAFLVASWLIAHKLSKVLVVLSIGLFTLVTLYYITMTYFVAQNLITMISLIRQQVESGQSTLGWVGFTQVSNVLPLLPVLIFTKLLAYIGTLLFFFYQRKAGADIKLIQSRDNEKG